MCTGTGVWKWRLVFGSDGPGGGGIRAMPLKGQSPGTNIYFAPPPNRSRASLDPLGPLAEVDFFYQVSGPRGTDRARRKNQGSTERARAPAGWTRKTNQDPARQIRARRTNQGSARQIRARKTNQGPAGTNQGPRNGSGPRNTNRGPVGRIRAPNVESGPA